MQEYLDSAPRNKDGIKITNSPALKYLTAVAHGKPVIIYATEITPQFFLIQQKNVLVRWLRSTLLKQ